MHHKMPPSQSDHSVLRFAVLHFAERHSSDDALKRALELHGSFLPREVLRTTFRKSAADGPAFDRAFSALRCTNSLLTWVHNRSEDRSGYDPSPAVIAAAILTQASV